MRRLANSNDPQSMANRLRKRRLEYLRRLLSPSQGRARVLDVGGTPGFWEVHSSLLADLDTVTVLNIVPQTSQVPKVLTVLGSALDLSPFEDASFDVVFSNSVIEHVGGYEAQRTMAEEIRRVGRRYLVQTPNKRFPMEPHFLVPWFQYMPERLRVELLLRHDLGWHQRATDRFDALRQIRGIRLMTAAELSGCFPGATIHRERVLGLAKSLIAIGGDPV